MQHEKKNNVEICAECYSRLNSIRHKFLRCFFSQVALWSRKYKKCKLFTTGLLLVGTKENANL